MFDIIYITVDIHAKTVKRDPSMLRKLQRNKVSWGIWWVIKRRAGLKKNKWIE